MSFYIQYNVLHVELQDDKKISINNPDTATPRIMEDK